MIALRTHIHLPAHILIEGGRILRQGSDSILIDGTMHCQEPARCILVGTRDLAYPQGIFVGYKTSLVEWHNLRHIVCHVEWEVLMKRGVERTQVPHTNKSSRQGMRNDTPACGSQHRQCKDAPARLVLMKCRFVSASSNNAKIFRQGPSGMRHDQT
jgi:hypothetical protein